MQKTELINFQAKICQTVAGFLVVDQKVVLVKHKKLGIWLAPGGHIEENELPHQAVEREFREETGLLTSAVNAALVWNDLADQDLDKSLNLPTPFSLNLHWISQENYDYRKQTGQSISSQKWPRGCEQHLVYIYLMTVKANKMWPDLLMDKTESDGIGWFDMVQINNLDTVDNIRQEAAAAIRLAQLINKTKEI